MIILDTDSLNERCSICGEYIDSDLTSPLIVFGGGKVKFHPDPNIAGSNLSVMHRSCYVQIK